MPQRIIDYGRIYPGICRIYILDHMTTALPKQIRIFNAILGKLGIMELKEDLVMQASSGRERSTKGLTSVELDALIRDLNQKQNTSTRSVSHRVAEPVEAKANNMRKRILSLCYTLGWTKFDQQKLRSVVDMERLEAWLTKYGYLHKALNEYAVIELPKLVTQFENLVKSTL